ncbi:unnamed protein product [Penicillium glandicola]
MPFPFECEPFYMRPFLLVGSIIGGFFTILVYLVIPVVVAIAILFGIFCVIYAIFGWELSSDTIKAEREKSKDKARKERDQKENEGKLDGRLSTSPLRLGDNINLEKRLEIELELLGEMIVARKERLAALKKTPADFGDDTLDLEVLEKVE